MSDLFRGLTYWFMQVSQIFRYKLQHLSPQEYCCIIVVSIAVGYCLLKGRN